MPQVIRLAAGEGQRPSPESEGFFESGLAQGGRLYLPEIEFLQPKKHFMRGMEIFLKEPAQLTE
jgi:hypothetical protein